MADERDMMTEFEEPFSASRNEMWCNESEVDVLRSYLEGSIMVDEAAENITARSPDGSQAVRF
jgi:hypothetical protein